MKRYGVEHLKTLELEIKMSGGPAASEVVDSVEMVKETPTVVPPQSIPPMQSTIPHHENEVANLLKLSNEELIDRMFPESPSPKDGE